MHQEAVVDLTRQALKMMVLLSAPLLLVGLAVGVLVNVFQAVTQITETSLTVVPKLAAMIIGFALLAPWMTDLIVDFTTQLFENIPNLIR